MKITRSNAFFLLIILLIIGVVSTLIIVRPSFGTVDAKSQAKAELLEQFRSLGLIGKLDRPATVRFKRGEGLTITAQLASKPGKPDGDGKVVVTLHKEYGEFPQLQLSGPRIDSLSRIWDESGTSWVQFTVPVPAGDTWNEMVVPSSWSPVFPEDMSNVFNEVPKKD